MFKKDDQVRVKGDSSQVGITTGVFNKHGSRNLVQVNVIGIGLKNFPEEHLELIDTPLSPLEELKNNKIVGPEILKLILAHIRLSGKLADMIYSMESSNTKFLAYQFKPVIKIINSPSNSILIADEVGLGKTIEAGLIWTELRARYDASRFIVLCPYSLTKKWQEELINKFGIDAKVIKADELYKQYDEQLKTARSNAQSVIAKSEQEAKDIVASEINQAREDAAKLIQQTNKELEAQKSVALQKLETQIDELSQLIKEKLLGKQAVL